MFAMSYRFCDPWPCLPRFARCVDPPSFVLHLQSSKHWRRQVAIIATHSANQKRTKNVGRTKGTCHANCAKAFSKPSSVIIAEPRRQNECANAAVFAWKMRLRRSCPSLHCALPPLSSLSAVRRSVESFSQSIFAEVPAIRHAGGKGEWQFSRQKSGLGSRTANPQITQKCRATKIKVEV